MTFIVKVEKGYMVTAIGTKLKKLVVVLSIDPRTRTIVCYGNPSEALSVPGTQLQFEND